MENEKKKASSATCWYGIKQVLELIAQLSIRAIQNNVCFILDIIKSTSVTVAQRLICMLH